MDDRRTAMVTGASSGIGREIAIELGRQGWPVAIGARRTDRLEETASEVRAGGGEPFAHELDVSDPKSIDTFFTAAETALGPLDVLVSNAATASPGWLDEVPVEQVKREVDTNLLGPILIARLAIKSMRPRQRGDLVFITSDATRHPRPRLTTYTATKAGLEGFAHCLSEELEGTGIRATTIRVGPTMSEFGFGWPMDVLTEIMEYWPRFGLSRHNGILDPSAIARAVVHAVTAPPGVHVDTVEVQPQAPVDDDTPGQPLERPDGS